MTLPSGPTDSRFAQLRQFMTRPEVWYRELAQRFGPVFTVHLFGQRPWVLCGEPELVRRIFTLGSDELVNASDGVKFMLGPRSVLFLEGEEHRRERRVLLPHFHHGRMRNYEGAMVASVDAALSSLRAGDEVRATDLLVHVTLRTIVECLFGVTDRARRDRLIRLFAIDMDITQRPGWFAASLVLGGDRVRGFIDGVVRRSGARFRSDDPPIPEDYVRRFVAVKGEIADILRIELERCRTEGTDGREDILALLARTPYDDGTPVDDATLIDHMMTLLIGGHETTSITLAWALYFLAKEPAVRATLMAELDEAFGDGAIEPDRVDALPYLAAVLDETMRIRPIALTVPRRVAKETRLGRFTLPAGTDVFPCPAVLHFREDLFPEPFAFRPERFLGKRADPFCFLPFGGGARTCVGRSFALVQMKLVLAHLLRRLEYHLAEGADPKMAFHGILMGPSDGVPLVVDRVHAPRGVRPTPR